MKTVNHLEQQRRRLYSQERTISNVTNEIQGASSTKGFNLRFRCFEQKKRLHAAWMIPSIDQNITHLPDCFYLLPSLAQRNQLENGRSYCCHDSFM